MRSTFNTASTHAAINHTHKKAKSKTIKGERKCQSWERSSKTDCSSYIDFTPYGSGFAWKSKQQGYSWSEVTQEIESTLAKASQICVSFYSLQIKIKHSKTVSAFHSCAHIYRLQDLSLTWQFTLSHFWFTFGPKFTNITGIESKPALKPYTDGLNYKIKVKKLKGVKFKF